MKVPLGRNGFPIQNRAQRFSPSIYYPHPMHSHFYYSFLFSFAMLTESRQCFARIAPQGSKYKTFWIVMSSKTPVSLQSFFDHLQYQENNLSMSIGFYLTQFLRLFVGQPVHHFLGYPSLLLEERNSFTLQKTEEKISCNTFPAYLQHSRFHLIFSSEQVLKSDEYSTIFAAIRSL